MLMRRFYFILLVFLPFICSCIGPADTGPGLGESGQGFSEAMRWHDFAGATLLLSPEIRGEFLTRFPLDNDDLKVVGSRIESVEVGSDKNSADAVYVLEYYQLPSSRVNKWRWLQHWQKFQEKLTKPGVWLITNAPPSFP